MNIVVDTYITGKLMTKKLRDLEYINRKIIEALEYCKIKNLINETDIQNEIDNLNGYMDSLKNISGLDKEAFIYELSYNVCLLRNLSESDEDLRFKLEKIEEAVKQKS